MNIINDIREAEGAQFMPSDVSLLFKEIIRLRHDFDRLRYQLQPNSLPNSKLHRLLYTKVTGSNTNVLRQRQNCYDVVPFFDLELHRKNTVKLLQTLCDLVESLHES